MQVHQCRTCKNLFEDRPSNRSVFCSLQCRRNWEKSRIVERFLSFVEKQTSGCWLWKGGKDKDGYGFFWFNGKNRRAPAMALFLLCGVRLPKRVFALHSCDTPSCVNPDHLFQGNQKANIQDAMRKGRRLRVIPPLLRGEKNNHAKLTEAQVSEMRRIYAEGRTTKRELAQKYEVSLSNVKYIIAGRTWAWLGARRETALNT
jgi:hypothetical protein